MGTIRGEMRTVLLLAPALGLLACAASRSPSAAPEATPAEAGTAEPGSAEPGTAPAGAGPAGQSSESAAAHPKGTPHPLLDDRAPDPAHALPRLSVKHVGLHVGGGTGTADERQGLLDALEAGQLGLLDCYRFVDRPNAGGTFGVDLYIGARGGHPEVRGLRHKLGGEGFEGCMVGALRRVTFGPQARPLVISYSLRFELSP